jgi:VWFA-related protein
VSILARPDSAKLRSTETDAAGVILMTTRVRYCLLLALLLTAPATAHAQQSGAAPADDGRIHLDVVVNPKSAVPVEGLKQQDFTLLDNKSPRPIASFQAFTGRQAPLEIVLVIDAVNIGAIGVDVQREAVNRYLRTEGGHLAYPLALAAATQNGIQIIGNFSFDGNVLAAALDKHNFGNVVVGETGGRNGANERWTLSINSLRALVSSVAPHHRRKLILWISPGWSVLAGLSAQLDDKQQQRLFGDVISMSTLIEKARVTLYSIDPLGAAESVYGPSYYRQFLEGVTKLSQVDVGDLALPVLAIQSGGLALHSDNDVAESIQQCLSDALPFYEITFDPASSDRPNEYHRLEVQLATAGLSARTRQGYYAQPLSRK